MDSVAAAFRDFNPRSHERSDLTDNIGEHILPISIHAPTRGATRSIEKVFNVLNISIHAPTRGAT